MNATIETCLGEATAQLRAVSDSARLDAELLLARALDVRRSYLVAHPEDELDAAAARRFFDAIERRAEGEPIAYLTGEKEFWSLPLTVGPSTLIPRPETERLVELALAAIPRRGDFRVLDLGTGSGAIALALASERPECKVTATDISEEALEIAALNARQLDIANVEFVHGDWVAPVAGRKFDLVVSNPPYVAASDEALRALRHEPRLALVAGPDGLDACRILAGACRPLLAPGGWLLLEHGAEQAAAVSALLEARGWDGVETFRDLAGLPRVTRAANTAD